MEFDPFGELWREPLTPEQRAEQRFIETCSELLYEWNPVDDLQLHDRLLEPLHRYLTESMVLLTSICQSETLSDRQLAIGLFSQLCEHFNKRRGFDRTTYAWSDFVTHELWNLTHPETDYHDRPLGYWATDDAAGWERFIPWITRLPWWPISPMSAHIGLPKFYDAANAQWLQNIPGPDAATNRLEMVRAWANAREVLKCVAESQYKIDNCILNAADALQRFRQAQEMVYNVLVFALPLEREPEDSGDVMFNTPAGSAHEAEHRARRLIADDPGFADRMKVTEWRDRIRCGAAMVKKLESWQALVKRKANQNGAAVSVHAGHADPKATSPAHDDELAAMIDDDLADKAEQEKRRKRAAKRKRNGDTPA